jgi:hypothetical protein
MGFAGSLVAGAETTARLLLSKCLLQESAGKVVQAGQLEKCQHRALTVLPVLYYNTYLLTYLHGLGITQAPRR